MTECFNCGAKLSDNDIFCGECGARVAATPSTAPKESSPEVDHVKAPEKSVGPTAKSAGASRFLPLAIIGCALLLVTLVICGVLVMIFSLRSPKSSDPVSLGGPSTPPATMVQKSIAPATDPIFKDTFDDNSYGWSEWKDEHGDKGIKDGVYYIAISNTEWASWSTADDRVFDNFVLKVEAQAVKGPDDNGYGVVFRYQDNGNFYYFEISSDGYYSIGKLLNDEWEILTSWTESDLIHLGQRTNTLHIECDGYRMAFFVNDYKLEELTDHDFTSGQVGFMAETNSDSGVRVHFDNLQVWAIE